MSTFSVCASAQASSDTMSTRLARRSPTLLLAPRGQPTACTVLQELSATAVLPAENHEAGPLRPRDGSLGSAFRPAPWTGPPAAAQRCWPPARLERGLVVVLFGVGVNLQARDPQLGLVEDGRAAAAQAHALLEARERGLEREAPFLQHRHALFQLLERRFELGRLAGHGSLPPGRHLRSCACLPPAKT